MSEKIINAAEPLDYEMMYRDEVNEHAKTIATKGAEVNDLTTQVAQWRQAAIDSQGHIITLVKTLGRLVG